MNWKDEVAALPRLSPSEFDVDPATTALMLIDVQYSDASRNHGWGPNLRESHPDVWNYYFDRVEQVAVPNMKVLLEAFRNAGLRVIHITLGPQLSDGADMTSGRRTTGGAIASLSSHVGSAEHAILSEVAPLPDELVVNKTSRGAFNSTGIDQLLRNLGIRTVVMAGTTTSACVETTARDAADRGYRTVIVDDASAELDQASHDATLRQFAVRWGRVWSTQQVLDELGV